MNTSVVPRKAALLGAFDRFNYGDLLFPIVVQNEIVAHSQETSVTVHALAESDLSQYGALKTHSLRSLYQKDALRPGDVVIFAGGGTIGVDWTYMYANLLGRAGNNLLYYLQRLLGSGVADTLSRLALGGRAPFPWVASPEDFPVPVSVAYNAVGGSEFANLSSEIQARTLDRLSKATYLSVRDAETQRLFAAVEKRVAVELAPDSAILMSEQFPLAWLEQHASAHVHTLTKGENYLCFQANLPYVRKHEERIVAMIEAIFEKHGLRTLLLPIGRYVGLDDQLALRNIFSKLRTPVAVVSDQASLWDIMFVIAHARIFVGTSLHGNITSQSFAVPHLGLGERMKCKVDYYLETWDLPEQARCVQIDDVCEAAGRVLAVPEVLRQKKRTDLIARSHENFGKMAHACGLDWQ